MHIIYALSFARKEIDNDEKKACPLKTFAQGCGVRVLSEINKTLIGAMRKKKKKKGLETILMFNK